MRAAIFRGPGDVEVGERPEPVIEVPTDAIVRVVLSCVCGSDLWYFRGESHVADAYAAMDNRRAIKSLIRVGAV